MTVTGYTHVAMELWGVIFCLISSLCICISGLPKTKSNRIFLTIHLNNALLLFADAFAWIFRGYPGTTGRYMVHISNFVVFIVNYMMLFLYTEYLVCYIGQDTKWKRVWRKSIWILVSVSIISVVISQFNHMYYYFDAQNTYHRNELFFLSQALGIAGSMINAVVLLKARKEIRKKEFGVFMTYLILPIIAMILQLFFYGIALLNIAITVSVLWMFVILQIERGKKLKEQGECLMEQAKQLVEQEHEMNDMQRKIMLSQIQPHFLYNSLNTIYYLCEKDTEVAQRAINDFSEYLRGNLDSLNTSKPVPFDTELQHLKNYLALEELRFADEMKIEYNIQERNFVLPALSVQPLVENAVKHGIGKAPQGGTITITTRKTDTNYEVIVEDNGVGFNPAEEKHDGKTHIGIENVRQRLQTMCGATLEIESTPDEGTEAKIKIPKENSSF